MTALRFQTGRRHQTSPASLRGERETDRQTDRETKRERQRETETETQREIGTERERERDRDTETQRETETERDGEFLIKEMASDVTWNGSTVKKGKYTTDLISTLNKQTNKQTKKTTTTAGSE